MKKLIFLSFLFMTGCSSVISLYPSYSDKIPKGHTQWFHLKTKENPEPDLYIQCYHIGRREVIKLNKLPLDANLYDWEYEVALYQGHCLRESGFIFKTSITSMYCYHYMNEKDCEAFKHYKR